MAPLNNASTLFRVDGLVAVVTGGGSGLGLYAARALDANGAKKVYIVGRREETLKAAAATAVNGNIAYIVGDVSDKASLQRVAAQVEAEQGFVNLLFANAGIGGPMLKSSTFAVPDAPKPSVREFQDELWAQDARAFTQTMDVNVTGVFYTAVAFLELLDAGNKKGNVAQKSQIITTSSIAAHSRQPLGFAYCASKAGVTHMMKGMSTVFSQAGYHIRTNIISPGLFPSELTNGMTSKLSTHSNAHGAFEGAYALEPRSSPSERTGSEEDFAGTVLYMASRAGAYLNGVSLITDGGRLGQIPSSY